MFMCLMWAHTIYAEQHCGLALWIARRDQQEGLNRVAMPILPLVTC